MKKLLVALVAVFAFAGTASATAPTPSFNRTIYIVNHSSVVSEAELQDQLPALQAGLGDFEKYWGGSIKLVLVASVPYRAWGITISDVADCTACLGYHGVKGGTPYGKVFTDPAYTTSVTFTHELFEMAADPFLHRADEVNGRFYLVEVGDPVEDDSFAYTHSSASGKPVAISDFVTDQWYRQGLAGGKYDYANHVKHSLAILYNGYTSYWGYNGWTQVFGRGHLATRSSPGVFLRPLRLAALVENHASR